MPAALTGVDAPGADEQAHATVAVFCGVVAAMMSSYYYGASVGIVERPGRQALGALALASFLVFFGQGWRAVAARLRIDGGPAWTRSDGALSLAALLILVLLGLATPSLPGSPLALLGLAGAASAALALRTAFRSVRAAVVTAFLAFAALLGVRLAWFVLVRLEDTLVHPGSHRDPLFHSALASMIQTYGVPSTGVDGVAYFPYHYGSHWVAAQLANLTGGTLLSFYQSTFRTVLVVFFIQALLGFVLALRERVYVRENRSAPALTADPVLWALLIVGIVGVHRGFGVSVLPEYHSSNLGSESFVLAQALAYCTASLLVAFGAQRERLRGADRLLLWVGLPLLLGAIGLSKISVLAIGIAVLGYLFIRYGLFRRAAFWAAAAIAALVVMGVLSATSLWASHPTRLTATHLSSFPARFLAEPWHGSATLAAYVFWPLIFSFSRFRALHITTGREAAAAFRGRRLVDVELVFLVAAVAAAPGMVAVLPGGADIYFAIVSMMAGLAAVMGSRGIPFRAAAEVWGLVRARRRPRLEWALVAFVAAPFFIRLADETVNPDNMSLPAMGRIARRAVVIPVTCLFGDCGAAEEVLRRQREADRPAAYRALRLLHRMQALPREEKRSALLFVPKSTRAYWGLNATHHRTAPCLVRPLIAPAIAGIAMLDGRPEASCDGVETAAYGRNGFSSVVDTSDGGICAAAAARGFARVLVMEPSRRGPVTVRTLSCPARS